MSVAVPVIDYIDGEARRIYLLSGVDAFHWIDDIYREYVNLRATDESLRKWYPLMNAKGNESKGGGKYTPRYVTLLNGCRVIPYDENILINVTGEAITDNADVDPDPFDTTTRVNPLKLYITPPAAEIVRDVESLAAIAYMSFNNQITVDVSRGYSIAEFTGDPNLLGNSQYPVNNFTDARTIADSKAISNLHIIGAATIATADVSSMTLKGENAIRTTLTLEDLAIANSVEITDAHLIGVMDGNTLARNCSIDGITYFNGMMHQCGLMNTSPITLGGSSPAIFMNCYAFSSNNSPVIIDFNNNPTPLICRDFHGGIRFINITEGQFSSIEMGAGTVVIDLTTCTNGIVKLAGLGWAVDGATGEHLPSGVYGGLTVINELVCRHTVADGVWEYERA